MNVLYKNLESLVVLEQLEDKTYDFIYLDMPYYTSPNHYFEIEFQGNSKGKSLKQYIMETRGVPYQEVTSEVVEQEREQWIQRGYKRYSDYVSKVIENTHRILKDNGILGFLAPMEDYTKINYKLVLDQFFPSITNVTIKMSKARASKDISRNPDCLLYFCSPISDFKFPVLMGLPTKDRYKYQDDHGDYVLGPAYRPAREQTQSRQYEWHGITPSGHQGWRYSREEMDEFFSEDRIVICDNRVSIKEYRDEHKVPVSTIWEYDDTTKLKLAYPRSIDSQSIERMFEMFVHSDSSILCPYDQDGKFSWMADQASYTWTSVCLPGLFSKRELFSDIPEDHYTVIAELDTHYNRVYQGGIITGINDVNELKGMMAKVNEIQILVGADSPEKAIDEIQTLIDDTVSESTISACLPEAQDWVRPYWDKLESESKHFIPTGVALYNQFLEDPDADMAAPMIEYCKALESELFKKLFAGFVVELRDRQVSVQEQFPEAFEKDDTKPFAEFLRNSLGRRNRNNPKRWKIELGPMVYILTGVLTNNLQEPLYADFRQYLNHAFEQDFFVSDFSVELDRIIKIRNDCAHPYIIDKDGAPRNREKIKMKLMTILQYYKGEDNQ